MQHIETACVQEGWQPKNGEPRVLPIFQSTTFQYDSAQTLGDLFDLKVPGHFYTRLSNPTLEAVENKIAALEGGIGAMVTASGQSAILAAVLMLCQAGDHVVSAASIYGGTYNLFNSTLRNLGIDFTFLPPDIDEKGLREAVRPNTKMLYGEVLANPTLDVLDIELYAKVAHDNGVPLIVDNTFPTPVLCRPFEFGADIVVHSTSKYMDGHAVVLGGVVVDSGQFNWARYPETFPALNRPDETYHGLVFTEHFGKAAFIAQARTRFMRDMGFQMSPNSAFLLNLGLETLALRMPKHSENGIAVAQYLEKHPGISWVNYPGLKSDPKYALARKYMPNGTAGVISFGVQGGRRNALKFMESLKLAKLVVHVADVRTCVLHPATTTHRQLSDAQLEQAGISPDLIRLSAGIENSADILADLEQALG